MRASFLPTYLIPGRPAYLPPRTVTRAPEAIGLDPRCRRRRGVGASVPGTSAPSSKCSPPSTASARTVSTGSGASTPASTARRPSCWSLPCARRGLLRTGSAQDFHGPEHALFNRFGAFELYGLEPDIGPLTRSEKTLHRRSYHCLHVERLDVFRPRSRAPGADAADLVPSRACVRGADRRAVRRRRRRGDDRRDRRGAVPRRCLLSRPRSRSPRWERGWSTGRQRKYARRLRAAIDRLYIQANLPKPRVAIARGFADAERVRGRPARHRRPTVCATTGLLGHAERPGARRRPRARADTRAEPATVPG